MKKTVAYNLEGKQINTSNLWFYGIVGIPEMSYPGSTFSKISKAFGGDQVSIKSLKEDEIDEAWKDIELCIKDGNYTKEIMPKECWKNLSERKVFSVEEMKELIMCDKSSAKKCHLTKVFNFICFRSMIFR